MDAKTNPEGKKIVDRAFDGLESELPDRFCRALRWLRSPGARWVRLPLGLLLIASSLFWFLPFVGIEWLPLGLLLISLDVPFLRRPVGLAMLWLESQWRKLKAYFRRRRAKRPA